MTNVKFYIDTDNAVMAYFPNIESSKGFNTCYSHIGQHSACHPDYIKDLAPATIDEYTELLNELVSAGYDDLFIINKLDVKRALLHHNDFSGLFTLPHGEILITIYPGGDKLHYYLFAVDNTLLLSGNDYKPSICYGIDSVNAIVDLLGFLTLRPGDTDSYYFKGYSPAALAWVETINCEDIRSYISDYEHRESEYHKDGVKFFETNYRQLITPSYGLKEITYRPAASHNPHSDILTAKIDADTVITYYVTPGENKEGCELYRGSNYVPGSGLRSYSRMWLTGSIPAKYLQLWNELKFLYNNIYRGL